MDMDEYQRRARDTDQYPDIEEGEAYAIPMMGIVGEVGSLVACFKKLLRDGDAYQNFKADLMEEMGDILWYVANLASKYDLLMSEVAEANLSKAKDRFGGGDGLLSEQTYYDADFDVSEQLPRVLTIQFDQRQRNGDTIPNVCILNRGSQVGDELTDNSFEQDGYRYHDVFHFAFAAVLGWSPVVRKLMSVKRRSKPAIDEVEDGARAAITEEAISLYVFNYAKDHEYLNGINQIDQEVLKTIKNLTSGLEVENRSTFEWMHAILTGFEAYRQLLANEGGVVRMDLESRTLDFEGN